MLDPSRGFVDGGGVEPTPAYPAVALLGEHAGPFEDAQVLADCGGGHLERLSQFSDRNTLAGAGLTKPGHDRAAGRVRQGGEGRVEGWAYILNHMVKYKVPQNRCQAYSDRVTPNGLNN